MSLEQEFVAVTGIGMILPCGQDTETTWSNICNGKSGISLIDSFNTIDLETKIAGEIKDFNPADYIAPRLIPRIDRHTQLAIVATTEAIKNAKIDLKSIESERISTIIGTGLGGVSSFEETIKNVRDRGPRRTSPFSILKILPNMASGQISMLFKTNGINLTVSTACASSADAIGYGLDLIRSGRVDIVLAGGAEASITRPIISAFNACRALSTQNSNPKQASKPFDEKRDGFVMSEGSAILVLERMSYALARKANIIAQLAGYAATSDAYNHTMPAPDSIYSSRCISSALNDAGLKPTSVNYVNAHGTSTQANDYQETLAIKKSFGKHAYKIAISSTKSVTGHLLGASGAVEAACSILAIRDAIIPPTINLKRPGAGCDLDYVPNTARRQKIDVAISNSMGFGGHNSCLVFKSY